MLFTLLASSTLIYNTMNVIESGQIHDLANVANIARMKFDDSNYLQYLPKLIWLMRDIPDHFQNDDATIYLNDELEHNELKHTISECFP